MKNEYDASKEKDEFERLRYEIQHRMKIVQTTLQQKSVLQNEQEAKKILERQKLETQIDSDLQSIKKNLDQLSTVYESQKKNKKKYGDVEGKGNILKGLGQGYDLLKSINEGTEVLEKGSKNFASQLEELVGKPGSSAGRAPVGPDREIYKEEEDKIDEWGNKIKQQDAIVNDVRKDIAQLAEKQN